MRTGILPELGKVLTEKTGNSQQLLQNGVRNDLKHVLCRWTQGRVWSPLPGLKTLASSLHVMSWYSTVLLSEVARSALLGFLGSCQVILSFLLRSTCLYDCTRDEHCGKHCARPSRKWGSILFLFFLQLCPICHIEILQVTHYLYEYQKHYLPYSFYIETIIVLTVWGQSHY